MLVARAACGPVSRETIHTILVSGFVDNSVKLLQPNSIIVRAIVTEQIHFVLLNLDIASWFETSVFRMLLVADRPINHNTEPNGCTEGRKEREKERNIPEALPQ